MRKKACPFCNDTIPEITFLQTKNFRAIYNHAPILPGHSLIIPKLHKESYFDLRPDEMCELANFSRRVARLLIKVFNADGFNWTLQESQAAGQTVAHLHFHIVPRYANDLPEPGDWYPKIENQEKNMLLDSEERKKISRNEIKKVVEKIRSAAKTKIGD